MIDNGNFKEFTHPRQAKQSTAMPRTALHTTGICMIDNGTYDDFSRPRFASPRFAPHCFATHTIGNSK